MKVEWMVALRYLRSRDKPTVLRLITLFAVLGVAAGVGTLVIALSMNAGFRQTLQDRLLGVTAHVNLTRPASGGIADYRVLLEKLRAVPGVRAVAPAIYQTVLLSAHGKSRGIMVKGIDPALEKNSNEILHRLAAKNAPDFSPDAEGIEAIVIGKTLAQELALAAGDYVTLTSPQGRLTPFGMAPRTRRFRVASIFDSGFYDYDANWAFVTIAAAQGLAGTSDLAGVLEFRITQLDRTDEMAQQILRAAGEGFSVSTWMDQNRALFRALRLEKLVTAIFIGLITFVAGLNILVVLAMTVTDKARDIAVLMSMGARREQVRNIFIWQGVAVGVFGMFLGLVGGYSLAWAADSGRWIKLDPEVYAIPYVPFHASGLDAFWIVAATLLISVLATYYPARAAARMHPAQILRFE
ncbi:MAG TPA: FtsX-like permease family protein [Candidatus Acidoferrales bacterium]|nr:FtsX-like permease family protein [Candidatus Acidoferrales bacterium]